MQRLIIRSLISYQGVASKSEAIGLLGLNNNLSKFQNAELWLLGESKSKTAIILVKH